MKKLIQQRQNETQQQTKHLFIQQQNETKQETKLLLLERAIHLIFVDLVILQTTWLKCS
jgi:hypothetical protein